MNSYVAASALAALDEIRGLLQAAAFAAQKFEQRVMTQEPVENGRRHDACPHPALRSASRRRAASSNLGRARRVRFDHRSMQGCAVYHCSCGGDVPT
jgi:hypothetical protein